MIVLIYSIVDMIAGIFLGASFMGIILPFLKIIGTVLLAKGILSMAMSLAYPADLMFIFLNLADIASGAAIVLTASGFGVPATIVKFLSLYLIGKGLLSAMSSLGSV